MMREYTWSGNLIRELIPIITRGSLLERVETIDRDHGVSMTVLVREGVLDSDLSHSVLCCSV